MLPIFAAPPGCRSPVLVAQCRVEDGMYSWCFAEIIYFHHASPFRAADARTGRRIGLRAFDAAGLVDAHTGGQKAIPCTGSSQPGPSRIDFVTAHVLAAHPIAGRRMSLTLHENRVLFARLGFRDVELERREEARYVPNPCAVHT